MNINDLILKISDLKKSQEIGSFTPKEILLEFDMILKDFSILFNQKNDVISELKTIILDKMESIRQSEEMASLVSKYEKEIKSIENENDLLITLLT